MCEFYASHISKFQPAWHLMVKHWLQVQKCLLL